jgi:hypothetical protein
MPHHGGTETQRKNQHFQGHTLIPGDFGKHAIQYCLFKTYVFWHTVFTKKSFFRVSVVKNFDFLTPGT